MDYIKGFTWGWCSHKGEWLKSTAEKSMKLMVEGTGSNTIIIAMAALQDKAQSTSIDYKSNHMVSDEELLWAIENAQKLGLKVILKPTVNVKDGSWRAHINFFDNDVLGEPQWNQWFESYTEYMLHYANIARETNCFMLVIGCEMVQAQRRDSEWRTLVEKVRKVYKGLITYNTDKYQEEHVTWWDAIDVISSSGYYPIDGWDTALERIEKVVKKYKKPFLFIEAGCPSKTGSSLIPNKWDLVGDVNLDEQASYYRVMFEKTKDIDWINGFGMWDWNATLYDKHKATSDDGYGVYGKPAEAIIKEFYEGRGY